MNSLGSGKMTLPGDDGTPGEISLNNNFLMKEEADSLFNVLRDELNWVQRKDRYGLQPRLTYWCGPHPYSYSGLTHQTQNEWHPSLLNLLNRLQVEYTGFTFNSVLCNLYRDQNDQVDWHSDDEPALRKYPFIASISLGAVRPFQMRRKNCANQPPLTFSLAHGSLFIMEGSVQEYWQHRLPPTEEECGPRINLTFRTIHEDNQ